MADSITSPSEALTALDEVARHILRTGSGQVKPSSEAIVENLKKVRMLRDFLRVTFAPSQTITPFAPTTQNPNHHVSNINWTATTAQDSVVHQSTDHPIPNQPTPHS